MGTRIGSGISTENDARIAASQAAGAAQDHLGDGPCDIACLFASGSHLAAPEAMLEAVQEVLAPKQLVGCCASGVLAGRTEIEQATGVTVWGASFSQGSVTAFHATVESREDELQLSGVPDLNGASGALLLVDPFTFPVTGVLDHLSGHYPGLPLVGGIASARTLEGTCALFYGEEVLDSGAVGVRFEGIEMLTCVSHGAIPLGPEITVTGVVDGNITELAGKPALVKLREVVEEMPTRERRSLETGLLLGIVVEPNKPEFVQGDFLVRGVSRADPDTGTIGIGADLHPGQVIRLHARDPQQAHDDLKRWLALSRKRFGGHGLAGALVFTCTGRGMELFGFSGHDAMVVSKGLHGGSVGGFFAGGEIGAVGHSLVVNSFTTSMAIFAK